MNEDIPQLLRQYFPQLTEKQLQKNIAEAGKIYHFSDGETIMDFGQYIKLVPLVINGSIKVLRENEDGKEILLYFLKAGESCSMSFTCCMLNKKSIIRTEADEDTTLIGIPIQYMDEWMSRYPTWKNFVMMSYDNRMVELVQVIDSIAFNQMDQRLWEYLLKKSSSTHSKVIKATHQEIANDLNASREAISRLLKQLEKLNKIQLSRNQITLL